MDIPQVIPVRSIGHILNIFNDKLARRPNFSKKHGERIYTVGYSFGSQEEASAAQDKIEQLNADFFNRGMPAEFQGFGTQISKSMR